MQARNRIRNRTKPLQLTETLASIYSNTKIYQLSITNSYNNTSFSCLSSSMTRIITPTLQDLKEKQTRLIKESRYFSCKKKGHNTYNCLKKGRIAAISKNISKKSNNQEKKQLFLKSRGRVYFFLHYLCQRTYFIRVF